MSTNDLISSINIWNSDTGDLNSNLEVNALGSNKLKSSIQINKAYNTPKRPGRIVSDTLIVFMRAIFDQNYQTGNWHLNPKEEMYIRNNWPENTDKNGVKPAIVEGKISGVRPALETLGEENFLPIHSKMINTVHGTDDIYTGRLSLKCISPVKSESEDMAFLCMVSINKFVKHLIGLKGIAHIHALGYSQAQPEDLSSEVKLWGTETSIEYVIKLPYSSVQFGDRLEGIELNLKEEN
jgi:hypothetical protein